jgi:hypothetical protein
MASSLRLEGESDADFGDRAERTAKYAKILVDAALANHCIQSLIAKLFLSLPPRFVQLGLPFEP